MPTELLSTIYSASPNIISQPTTISAVNTTVTPNPVLTPDQTDNLVPLTIDPTQVHVLPFLYKRLLVFLLKKLKCPIFIRILPVHLGTDCSYLKPFALSAGLSI